MLSKLVYPTDALRLPQICGLVATLALTGCDTRNTNQDAAAPTGQVIARVGTEDITAQELENEFRLANVLGDKRSDALTKLILGEIVLRKYLVQQAIAAKLDQEPAVNLDLTRAREQVLAGEITQRTVASEVSSIGKPGIDQYIGAHPSQFAEREILNIDQIIVPINSETQIIVDTVKTFKTLDQVDRKLKELGVLHEHSTGVLDSGNISIEIFAVLQAKKDDDIFFVRNGANGTFFKITGERSRPLTGDEATNRARQLMRMDLMKAAGEQAEQAAKAATKYEGEYAKLMGVQASQNQSTPAVNN